MRLDDLIDKTLAIIKIRDYTENTWNCLFRSSIFNSLRQFFAERGQEEFCTEFTCEYMNAIQNRFAKGEISYWRYAHLRKLAAWLIEVYQTGELHWKQQFRRKMFLQPYFENVFSEYVDSMKGVLSDRNVDVQKSMTLHFLEFLESQKAYNDFNALSLKDIQDFVIFKSQQRQGRMDLVIHAIKRFVSYLRETAIIDEDLTPALHMQAQKVSKILKGFTHEEVDRILAQPDRSTPIGKRNYAIILLGRNTGLRIGDIINLKFSDVNWMNGQLTITQHKTRKTLALPLEPEVQNAIKDYIDNGRPKSYLPFVFLRYNAPYDKLSQQAVTLFFTKYRSSAGIATTPHDGKGFHGLRRSIARWMLEAEVPLTTISQVLGHHDLDSAAPYLSFDENRLRQCSLSLHGIEVAKEELI